MKKQQDFVIPFIGLSTGSHAYEFKIDKAFFEGFDYFETETGNVDVEVELIKEPALLDLHFKFNGTVNLACDRCLERLDQPVEGDFRLIAKFGESYFEESDEVIVLPATASSIDLRQYIFEYINLLLPIKRVHQNLTDCDPVMLQKLQNYSEEVHDPRWDALKNIKLK